MMLAGLFMLTVAIACFFRPEWDGDPEPQDWNRKIRSLSGLLPPLGIFLVVVGSIYAGVATPTEGASLGVIASLGLAAANRTLTIAMLKRAIEGTMRTTAMIMLIILAAIFLNFILAAVGLTSQLTDFVTGLGLTPMQTMLMIIGFYIVLGCFMETLSMLLTTAPLIAPVVISLGFDPVWFGVLLMVLLETALITPPIGINLYVVQGIRKKGGLNDVMIGTLPFVLAMFAMIGLLLAFPDLALWLPGLFY
ncbi:MAG: TRAP transporter large permease subunit [Rhodospirillales bacterium]